MIKMTVQQIFDFLNQKFPTETALGFDNVGLLIGDCEQEVSKAVIALDCTMSAINRALEIGAELIITHHPVIFDPLKTLLKGSIAYEVVKNGISVISMHTNLDIGEGGVNDVLCEVLSPKSIETFATGDGYFLKKCQIEPVCANDLAQTLKEKLGGCVKYTDAKKPIEKVLVCSGSGGGYVNEVNNAECDALLTADVKHNHFVDAETLGVSLFDAGHFNTEDVVVEPLKELLKVQFPKVEFTTYHSDTIKYI